MKRLLLIFTCTCLLAVQAVGQKPPEPKYDPATETTLKGVVEDVREVPNGWQGKTCVYVKVKTAAALTDVQIAPAGFLKDLDITFSKGEQVQIIGSKVEKDGAPLFLARSVVRGNDQIDVRADDGAPLRSWQK